ncbi:MAG: hypothetical protein NVS2B16_18690 [Chloroflexota bacterium]
MTHALSMPLLRVSFHVFRRRLKHFTQALDNTRMSLHWRYCLLRSRGFPIQYDGVASSGCRPNEEEILANAIAMKSSVQVPAILAVCD